MFGQRTIKYPMRAKGVGLHSGKQVNIRLLPAEVNRGVVFRLMDSLGAIDFPVSPELVGETTLCTTLVKTGRKVGTIEHIMSAIAGLGIDNLIIEIDGNEVPIMDGSANPFLFLLQSAGIEEQDQPKRFVRILQPIRVDGQYENFAELTPHDGFKLSFSIDFSHPAFEKTTTELSVDFSSTSYFTQVGRARTFGFMKDVEYLRKNNLALGGSLNNAIVLDDSGILNEDGLRFEDEFVKHKILDAVGDLYVLGYNIIGHFNGHKAGHALNNQLVRKLLAEPDKWEFVTFDKEEDVPLNFVKTKVA